MPGIMRLFPLLVLLFATGAAAASAPRRCAPAQEGVVACLDGKLCECRHDPGGSLSGRHAGTRWDCGALRPACGDAAAAPASDPASGQAQPLPPFLPMPSPPPGWR